jgi:hypothetical protein
MGPSYLNTSRLVRLYNEIGSLEDQQTFEAIVSFPMSMTSGEPVLQLTIMRNCRPPHDAKSTAMCWNSPSGNIFEMMDCLAFDGRRS